MGKQRLGRVSLTDALSQFRVSAIPLMRGRGHPSLNWGARERIRGSAGDQRVGTPTERYFLRRGRNKEVVDEALSRSRGALISGVSCGR